MSYSTLKAVHILGAVLLLGNITVSAVWKSMADRTRDPRIVAFAQRQVARTDWLFTLPGAVLLVATGDYIAYALMTDSWAIGWVRWGRLFFIAAGLIWVLLLVPIQIKQARLARLFEHGGSIPDEYWRLNRLWIGFGLVALLLPAANLYWMVFKPV